ncbi:uncharacterized protein LOC121776421 isoform X2 [Salvia splendens]|uniref:uncharacterized protein LOC121776421 isoform X2 n=1 Tax=Salvia splendens TaxID=180675 RepID=UPI001C264561|nr:uncharacterized protein LOC121776421 isoform X2 [Salvia splendens]
MYPKVKVRQETEEEADHYDYGFLVPISPNHHLPAFRHPRKLTKHPSAGATKPNDLLQLHVVYVVQSYQVQTEME